MDLYQKVLKGITALDNEALTEARNYIDFLAKPVGSLGKLEKVAIQIAGITGQVKNSIQKKCTIVMAADNGIYEENVATTPQNVTAVQAINMLKGRAGISVLSKQAKADVKVVDIGILSDITYEGIINKKIRKGTRNFAKEPAMTSEEVIAAIETGIELVDKCALEGYQLIGTGEMGIANTTTSSAVFMALSGCHVDLAVGKGAGLTDQGLAHKKQVIQEALKLHQPTKDPIDVLSKVGGLDIAGLTGCFLAAAYNKVPVVIDGLISSVAAYTAYHLNPLVQQYMIPSHCSLEPAYNKIMDEMELEPMLMMDMRLGEGTGCPLAFSIIESALAMVNHMATFKDIEVDNDYMVDIR